MHFGEIKMGQAEMRTVLIAVVTVAGIGVVGVSNAPASPINGVVVDDAANIGLLTEQVHCRWYPHRHRNNYPHGWGRGCASQPKVPKKK
jgi:hypothetical protein